MPYAVGDILRIEDVQSIASQTVRNVYFYELTSSTGPVTGEEILDAFDSNVVADVVGIQATALTHTALKIDNVTDQLSFAEIALSGRGGVVAATAMPSYVAFSFKLLRGSKLTRNGFKRIPGPTETQVEGNFVTTAFVSGAELAAVVDALEIEITVTGASGSATIAPVIASRPTDTRPNYVTQPVIGVQFETAITSQVSRKFGRGE